MIKKNKIMKINIGELTKAFFYKIQLPYIGPLD